MHRHDGLQLIYWQGWQYNQRILLESITDTCREGWVSLLVGLGDNADRYQFFARNEVEAEHQKLNHLQKLYLPIHNNNKTHSNRNFICQHTQQQNTQQQKLYLPTHNNNRTHSNRNFICRHTTTTKYTTHTSRMFSLIRWLSSWHCTHLLLSTVLQVPWLAGWCDS